MLHPNDNAGKVLHKFDETIEQHEKLIKALALGSVAALIISIIALIRTF